MSVADADAMASLRTPTAYVVDDDASIRALWRWLMESNGIGVQTFTTAAQFIEAYRGHEPGCLILDLRLPGMSGLELQQYLNAEGITIPIVFITGYGDVSTAVRAIKGGAVDFIQKPFSCKAVLTVIQKALQRDAEARERQGKRTEFAARLAHLTAREHEVMNRVIAGKANKVIASELAISVKTVEVHRARVMDKSGVPSVAELVRLMMQQRE